MKKITQCLFVFLAVLLSWQANAQEDCSQEQVSNNFENALFIETGGQEFANDLVVTQNTTNFTLNSIQANLYTEGGVESVDIAFYDDDNGLPGAQIGSTIEDLAPTSSVNVGTAFGYDVEEVTFDLPTPMDFSGTGTEDVHYWVQIDVLPNNPEGAPDYQGAALGITTVNAIGYTGAFKNDSAPDWTEASGDNGEPQDGVLSFYGTCTYVNCPSPEGISIDNVTVNSVDLSWNELGNATEWTVIYGDEGFDPNGTNGTTQSVTGGTPEATITGLSADMDYEFYVKSTCSASEESAWAGPVSASTGYCDFEGTDSSRYIDDFITTGGETNINNTGSGFSTDGYNDATAMVVSQYAGGTINFTVNMESSTFNVGIWVDWNNNMEFEASEQLYNSDSYESSAIGSFDVPAGTANGDYRLRVANFWIGDPVPCGTTTYGEAEDYTVTVVDPPACIHPTDVEVTNLTPTTAEVTWTELGTATEWEVIYGDVGFDPEGSNGTTMPDDDNDLGVTITGLSPQTEYDVYAKAVCGADGDSAWAGPAYFETTAQVDCDAGPLTNNFCYDADETIGMTYTSTDPNAVLNFTVNSGEIYTFAGDFIIYDSDGTTVLYSGQGDDGDLSGISVQSTGDQISFSYEAGFYGCGESSYTAIDLTVACATCTNPEADFNVLSNCEDGDQQFSVEVDVTDLGSASSVDVSDSVGSAPQALTSPGVVTFGPYPYGAGVVMTVTNNDDSNCFINSDELTQDFCGISTDITTYTVEELVIDVLIDNPCADVSNVTSSTGSDFGDPNGLGYFSRDGADFPLEDGVIMSSGAVTSAPGPHTGGSDGSASWPGDPDIDDLIQEIEGSSTTSNNASVIEFDFVPYTDHISFDYVFASDEYGTYQCTFSDAFGFFLTDADGNTTNLATIPGTDTPVAVTTIRDEQYTTNTSCGSDNEEYFDTYYGTPNGLPEEIAPINYHGHTVAMTAESDVNPGQTYHIKLAIADRADTSWDSAVFLQAGSFDIGGVDLGQDLTLDTGNAPCEGDTAILDPGLGDDISTATITWYKGSTLIPGENEPTLEVTEPGNYTISVIFGGTCSLSDSVEVQFAPNPEVDLGDTVSICGGSATLDGTPINISDLESGVDYTWYFNGTEIAGETGSTLDVDEIGTYTVEVTSGFGCTGESTVDVTDSSFSVNLGEDQVFCDQDSYEITAEVMDEDPANATYEWEGPSGPIAETTQTISVSETGTYTVTVDIGGCTGSDSVDLDFNSSPEFDLGEDIVTCSLDELILDASPSNHDVGDVTFEWDYNGNPIAENGPTVNVADYGYGTYTVTLYAGDPDCDTTQSITIDQISDFGVELTTDNELTKELNYCDGDTQLPSYEVTFTASLTNAPEGSVEYTWYKNGDALSDVSGETYTVTYDTEGEHIDDYTVEATLGGCIASSSVTTDISIVPYDHPCKITEGLSPGNNDGINDCLDLSFVGNRSGIANFKVFNRYGVKVYEKSNYIDTWCGQDDDGDELISGTYYYVLEMKNEDPVFGKSKRGWIYLNRKSN